MFRSIVKWLKEQFMGGTKQSCDMAPTLARRIKVKVEMDLNGNCWNYAIEADDQASDPYVKAGNKVDLGKGPGTGAEIEFRIQGKVAGQQLDFDTSDPIWVAWDDCPTSSSQQVPNEIEVVDCKPNKLTIRAFNRDDGNLAYRLNFNNGQFWDPIIRNGGGGP